MQRTIDFNQSFRRKPVRKARAARRVKRHMGIAGEPKQSLTVPEQQWGMLKQTEWFLSLARGE